MSYVLDKAPTPGFLLGFDSEISSGGRFRGFSIGLSVGFTGGKIQAGRLWWERRGLRLVKNQAHREVERRKPGGVSVG